MAKRINIFPLAQQDLDSIFNYINNDLNNPTAAIKLINQFEYSFNMLALFPESGPLVDNKMVKNYANYRKLIVNNYIAFYTYNDDEVLIVRVISGMRDYYDLL